MERISRTLGLLFGLLIVVSISTGIGKLFVNILFENSDQYNTVAASLGGFITLAIIYKFCGEGKNIAYIYKLKRIKLKDILYIILMGIALSIVLSILIDFLTQLFPSYEEVSNRITSQTSSILNIMCIVVLVPIYEEIIFRGIIFNHLKENYKIGIAIVVQALVFGIEHGNIVQSIYTFILGIVLALMYMYFNSIYANIMLHMIFNLFGGVIDLKLYNLNKFTYYILATICFVFLIMASYKMVLDYRRNHRKWSLFGVK
ncbi:CPBP family intramembrane metalloprotease [Paraclostridium bifermentans]|uniref:CPBP family intramembrane glutamic endopeptidase n=1 Tax=Paraclostridium TaxID=1849822 RepID=UPI001CC7372D|nr:MULTISPECIES: type II CAAX endopeptidase family protein [Paraclostridium]MBZ6006357.1 CPBP family intramembrane metalloprotease [Paraclostridium bifermentans]MDU0298703.1 type II CAAX endopeptidase family protein [Paraclostridium sp. MRS3W1]